MKFRRGGCFFIILMLIFVAMIFRIFYLSTGENARLAESAVGNRRKELVLYNTKGIIYDASVRPIAGNQPCSYLVVNPREFPKDQIDELAALCEMDQEALAKKLKKETPFVLQCKNEPKELAGVERYDGFSRYSGVAAHLLGYLDSADQVGLSGAEKEFDSYLNLFSSAVTIEYAADALNGIIPDEKIEKEEATLSENGLVLTLDRDLCEALETSMDRYIEKGAAVILDCKSGEIKAICSRPSYNTKRIGEYLESKEGELINRALSSQTVGSVFKIVVAAAALEQGLEDFRHSCTGGIMISDQTIACHNRTGHGELGLKEAFSDSCNAYFIALGQMLGSDIICEMAKRFGFGESISILGSIASSSGNLPKAAGGLALANLSIGQGELMASPLQIARMTSVIANGGLMPQPTAYKGLYLNKKIKEGEEGVAERIISEEYADLLLEYCIETVETGTATAAKPGIGKAGGKTSSAETGIISDGKEQLNVYFTGFYPADDPQYVITVFAEDGISGGKTCGPVFREVCDFIGENFLTP